MGVYEVMCPSLDACSQMDFISFLELSASSDTIEQSYPENFFFQMWTNRENVHEYN